MNTAIATRVNPASRQVAYNHISGRVRYFKQVYLFDVKDYIGVTLWFTLLPLQNQERGQKIIQAHLIQALEAWEALRVMKVFSSTIVKVRGQEVYIVSEGAFPFAMLDRALKSFELNPQQVNALIAELQGEVS